MKYNLNEIASSIVSSALGSSEAYKGTKYDVSVSSYVSSLDEEHPTHICFPVSKESSVEIFCVYTSLLADSSPLEPSSWDFYVLSNCILAGKDFVTLPYLQRLCASKCSASTISNALDEII